MPTHMRRTFEVEEIRGIEKLQEPFKFTKGCKTVKIKARPWGGDASINSTLLFDLKSDPEQLNPLNDKEIEETMTKFMVSLMKETDAPIEQFTRLGLEKFLSS
jgi:hypothetical protein